MQLEPPVAELPLGATTAGIGHLLRLKAHARPEQDPTPQGVFPPPAGLAFKHPGVRRGGFVFTGLCHGLGRAPVRLFTVPAVRRPVAGFIFGSMLISGPAPILWRGKFRAPNQTSRREQVGTARRGNTRAD